MIRNNMTERELMMVCKKFAKEHWGMDFNIPVKVSGRMTVTLGAFYHSRKTPTKVVFSKNLIQNYKPSTIKSVILHELTHWVLFMQNKPFKDTDRTFIQEAKKVGASLTGTIQCAGKLHKFVCTKCRKTLLLCSTRKKTNLLKKQPYLSSKCCQAGVVYTGVEYVEDTF